MSVKIVRTIIVGNNTKVIQLSYPGNFDMKLKNDGQTTKIDIIEKPS